MREPGGGEDEALLGELEVGDRKDDLFGHGWGGGGRAGSLDTHRVRTTTGHEGSAFSDAVIAGIVSADPVFDNSSIV